MNQDILWLALSRIRGIGIKKLISISNQLRNDQLDDYNSITNVLQEIYGSIYDKEQIKLFINQSKHLFERHEESNIRIITYTNTNYPKLLKLISDPPVALYCKGNIDTLNSLRNIAIIGTRNATNVGLIVAEKIASSFVRFNYQVVSGLAKGIDTAAHKGTLTENGTTIAVLASSPDKIYPKENTYLAEEIISKGGLLISEYPIGTFMNKSSFVKRNRIQSGLSLGVCVVQTDIKGGSMHTVSFAEKQKRLIFCPSPIEDSNLQVYRGVNKLLNEKRAALLKNENDYMDIQSLIIDKFTKSFPEMDKLLIEAFPEHNIVSSITSDFDLYNPNKNENQLNLFSKEIGENNDE